MNIVTTKEQDHDRKHGGGAKQLTAGQVHENNHQELLRYRIYDRCQKDAKDAITVSVLSDFMQCQPEKMRASKTWAPPIKINPRKLLRKLRKAAA